MCSLNMCDFTFTIHAKKTTKLFTVLSLNSKRQYKVHYQLPLHSIQRHMKPVHNLKNYFFNICFQMTTNFPKNC